MARGKRCPYGTGRKASQKARRIALAQKIADAIFPHLDLDWIESTGSLFPRKVDLRKRKTRLTFQHLAAYKGRVFTKRLCLLVTRKLHRMLPFDLARSPRESKLDCLTIQSERLHLLAKKCKRMTDNTETQEWPAAHDAA